MIYIFEVATQKEENTDEGMGKLRDRWHKCLWISCFQVINRVFSLVFNTSMP